MRTAMPVGFPAMQPGTARSALLQILGVRMVCARSRRRQCGEGIEHRHMQRREITDVARQDGQAMALHGRS